jgi:hypothetical protein
MAANKTLACGEEHPPHTTTAGCEEDLYAAAPVENPFGAW